MLHIVSSYFIFLFESIVSEVEHVKHGVFVPGGGLVDEALVDATHGFFRD